MAESDVWRSSLAWYGTRDCMMCHISCPVANAHSILFLSLFQIFYTVLLALKEDDRNEQTTQGWKCWPKWCEIKSSLVMVSWWYLLLAIVKRERSPCSVHQSLATRRVMLFLTARSLVSVFSCELHSTITHPPHDSLSCIKQDILGNPLLPISVKSYMTDCVKFFISYIFSSRHSPWPCLVP